MALKDIATEDGYDIQMQTNHLSHFLLAKDLYPLERAASRNGEARVVSHSSGARHMPRVPIAGNAKYLEKNGGNLGGDSSSMFCGGARWIRYHMTKLANSVFTQALHQRLQSAGSEGQGGVRCSRPRGDESAGEHCNGRRHGLWDMVYEVGPVGRGWYDAALACLPRQGR